MRLAAVRILLTCTALTIPLLVLAAMRSSSSPFAARPAEVVIEGVIVQGETYRVEPLTAEQLETAGPGVAAEIRVTNRHGEVVRARSDERGRFRVGPIEVAGDERDVLTVSAPSCRSLSMSCLLPAEVRVEADGTRPRVVRWRIVLPRLPESSTPSA
ncbi:MAG: hypothetical protein Kow0062_11350 [Acidobacteriota bacterium]